MIREGKNMQQKNPVWLQYGSIHLIDMKICIWFQILEELQERSVNQKNNSLFENFATILYL
jgi:hypothetical protein